MPEFLTLRPPAEALQTWFASIPQVMPKIEEVDSSLALHRITALPVIAEKPIPEFARSTMDGFAVIARDTYGASATMPAFFKVIAEVPMGKAAEFAIHSGEAALIHTGGMLPDGADAVVILENCQRSGSKGLEVFAAVTSNENTVQIGEDIQAGQIVIPAGTRLRPAEIGGLMALGQTRVKVARKPQIAVLSSGDEVIPPDQEPLIGQVRDINAYSLSAQIENWGGEPQRLGILPDQAAALKKALASALQEYDAVIITAGSSASVRDMTSEVINELGKPGVLVHGVSIKPGKPTILAVCDGKPVVGLPGNPVSALVSSRLFIRPLVHRLLGQRILPVPPTIAATLATNIPSQAGREDWWPIRLIQTPEGMKAEPIFFKSALIFNYASADGILRIPADITGLTAGTVVDIQLL